MPVDHSRMIREKQTVEAMIGIYCHAHHGTESNVCPECAQLKEYANLRLVKCPFQENKTTCTKCPIHCYKPAMREEIRAVMRYAGPRMLYRHPILAVQHLIDGRRKEPLRPIKTEAAQSGGARKSEV